MFILDALCRWKVQKLSSGDEGWVGSYCLEKMTGAVVLQEPATPTDKAPISDPLSKKE